MHIYRTHITPEWWWCCCWMCIAVQCTFYWHCVELFKLPVGFSPECRKILPIFFFYPWTTAKTRWIVRKKQQIDFSEYFSWKTKKNIKYERNGIGLEEVCITVVPWNKKWKMHRCSIRQRRLQKEKKKKLSVDWLIRMMFILWQSIFLPVYAMLLLPKLNYLFRYFSEKDAWYVKYTSHTSIEIKPFAVVSPAICNFAIFREPYSFIVPTRPIYSHTKLIFHVCMEKKGNIDQENKVAWEIK